MKIAVTAQGPGPEAALDPRFGRAAGFVIYDTDSGEYEYADNSQNLNLPQGAGIQAAQNVAATGVKTVITGHAGPKAFLALEKGGIAVHLCSLGTVREALDAFEKDELDKADGPDKQGHW